MQNIPTDGYSLKALIEGKAQPKYDFAVSERQWKSQNVPSLMIRTDKWKLMTTHRSGGANVEMLFVLGNDSHEMNNLLSTNPERYKYKKKADELCTKLVGYLKQVNYPLVEGLEQR